MRRFELICILVSVIGLTMKLMLIKTGGGLFSIPLLFLSMMYFFGSIFLLNNVPIKNARFKDIPARRLIRSVGVGFALSTIVMGIMFKIMCWPGGSSMLFTGMIILYPVAVALLQFYPEKDVFHKRILFRAVPVSLIAFIIYMTPSEYLWRVFYRDHPSYIAALIKQKEDPRNSETLKLVEEERYKMQKRK